MVGKSIYMGRHTLTGLLTEVADILRKQNVAAQVSVVGGGCYGLGV